ncbi:MAG: hypothetical protein HUU16_01360 [Candidatus Omnitrophica bacterium]|nr:hypothetical protein [Candidatus Omnitrophota bacterium]
MDPQGRSHALIWLPAWLCVAAFYLWILKAPPSRAYIDFGDGNYQYISRRLVEGVQLYTQILSPQPPFHLWLGSLLVRLSEAIGMEPLLAFRWCIHLIRALTALCAFGVAWRLFGKGSVAFLAGSLFFLLPEGYRWSQSYQSEHLELLLLSFGWFACLGESVPMRCLAGIAAAGAVWTNMSALPFSVLLALHAGFAPTYRWPPLVASVATGVVLLGACFLRYGEKYIENVWTNQVASFPSDPRQWLASLAEQGTAIVTLEGLVILAALIGMYRFLHDLEIPPRTIRERLLVVGYGIISVGSAVYVIKGGTVDYIFMLAETALAVFAAASLRQWFVEVPRMGAVADAVRPGFERLGPPVLRVVLLVGAVVLLGWHPFRFLTGARFQFSPGVDLADQSAGRVVEFSDREARTLERLIREFSKREDLIWAPPYLAAISERTLAMDLSETYLWWVRWHHSLPPGDTDPEVDRMIEGFTELASERKIALFLTNDRTGQWGQLLVPNRDLPIGPGQGIPIRSIDPRIERLQKAIEENYEPLRAHPGSEEKLYFQGWNERLEVWVPKGSPTIPPPWVQEGFGA